MLDHKYKILNVFGKMAFQTPISISLLISFVGLYLCAVLGNIWILFLSLLLSCAITLCAHLAYAADGREFSDSDRLAIRIVIGVYALTALSLSLFSVRTAVFDGISAVLGATIIWACLFWAMFAFELMYFLRVVPKTGELRLSKKTFLSILPFAAVCGAVVLLSLENFGAWIRWDSYDYYYYLRELSYSGLTVLDNLRPANHAAYGVSIIYLLVDGVVGNAKISLLLINILMLVAGSFAFWRILEKLYPHWKQWTRAICVAIYAFSPFLFGLAWSVNLEAFLIFGLVMFFWGDVERMPMVQTASALLICFSKEIGAVLLASIVVARLILDLVRKNDRERSFFLRIEPAISLPILGYGLVWFYDFLTNNWIATNSTNKIPMAEGSSTFNSFGFDGVYIVDRIRSLFFTNFSWLLIGIVCVGFVIGLVRKKHSDTDHKHVFLIEVFVGALVSLIPLFFFITYNHIRYASPTVILMLLLLPEALDRMLYACKWRAIACGALAACFLVQSYITIDPMMYLFCGEISKGKGSVAFADNSILENGKNGDSISVDAQYNREIMYFDRALDNFLREIEYDENTVLIISNLYIEPTINGYVGSEYLILGFGYPYMKNPMYVSWDSEKGERYLSDDPDDAINIRYMSSFWDIRKVVNHYDRCIYIAMPFEDLETRDAVLNRFNPVQIKSSNPYGWSFSAYELSYRK